MLRSRCRRPHPRRAECWDSEILGFSRRHSWFVDCGWLMAVGLLQVSQVWSPPWNNSLEGGTARWARNARCKAERTEPPAERYKYKPSRNAKTQKKGQQVWSKGCYMILARASSDDRCPSKNPIACQASSPQRGPSAVACHELFPATGCWPCWAAWPGTPSEPVRESPECPAAVCPKVKAQRQTAGLAQWG